jgi:hypothetical protein
MKRVFGSSRIAMSAVIALVLAGTGLFGWAAAAQAATPVPTQIVLPLFGSPVTLNVSFGADGKLSDVTMNPTGWTETDKPRSVSFVNTDGSAKVVVRANDGVAGAALKVTDPTQIKGTGSWSGDVFGTGEATKVEFYADATDPLAPVLKDIKVVSAAAAIKSSEVLAVKTETDDDGGYARGTVRFSTATQTRVLSIGIKIESNDDHKAALTAGKTDDLWARVKIGLGPIHKIDPAIAPGTERVWTGKLCAGAMATINYKLDSAGVVTVDSATPAATVAPAAAKDNHSVIVTFTDGSVVKISGDDSGRDEEHHGRFEVDVDVRCPAPAPAAVRSAVNDPKPTVAAGSSKSSHD